MKFDETVILEDRTSFMTVRHLVLQGSNYEIGSKLAEIGIQRHGFSKSVVAAPAPSLNLAFRRYFAEHYPTLLERARGVADALAIDPEDDRFDFTAIPYNQYVPRSSGCSTVYYPSSITETGHSCLSRNCDFPLLTLAEMMGIELPEDERKGLRPLMADPYVIEMHPSDGGYPSISLVAFDLLSGVLDGINGKGLTVAVHGNEITMVQQQDQPQPEGIGLHELQSMRLLLDTCASVEEAKQTLRANRHFYVMLPCIYLVADREGNSFVFEPAHNTGESHIIEGSDDPLTLTNHPLSLYPSADAFPEKRSMLEAGTSSFLRYEKLSHILKERSVPYSVEDMKQINAAVSVSEVISWVPESHRAEVASSPGLARTLWHAVYDSTALSLEVKFYTRDGPLPDGGFEEKYTEYCQFALER